MFLPNVALIILGAKCDRHAERWGPMDLFQLDKK